MLRVFAFPHGHLLRPCLKSVVLVRSLSNTTYGGFVCFMSAGYGYAILANVVECWMYLIYPMKFSPFFSLQVYWT